VLVKAVSASIQANFSESSKELTERCLPQYEHPSIDEFEVGRDVVTVSGF